MGWATRVAVGHAILLRPDLRERLDCWELLEPVHPFLRRLFHTGKQVEAVVADPPAQCLTLRLLFGKARVFYPVPIPLIPVRRDLLLEPVWRHRRQHIQRRAQRLPDELELVQRSHSSQHMC